MEIVERHQAEKLLRLSDEKLRYILNNSPDTLYTIELHTGTYDYISPSCLQTTGYTEKEIVALGLGGIAAFFHADDRERLRQHFLKKSFFPEKQLHLFFYTIQI